MKSLNIISSRVSPPPSPVPSRSNSLSHVGIVVTTADEIETDEVVAFPCTSATATTTSTSIDPAILDDPSTRRRKEKQKDREKDRDWTTMARDSGSAGFMTTAMHEKTPLLATKQADSSSSSGSSSRSRHSQWQALPLRLVHSVINSVRWMLSTLAAPGVYLIACLYDEQGNFAPVRQLQSLFERYRWHMKRMSMFGDDMDKEGREEMEKAKQRQEETQEETEKIQNSSSSLSPSQQPSSRNLTPAIISPQHQHQAVLTSGSSSSGRDSDSESDAGSTIINTNTNTNTARRHDKEKSPSPSPSLSSATAAASASASASTSATSRHARSKSLQPVDEIAPSRRSIRIKLHNDEALRQRKTHRKNKSSIAGARSDASNDNGHGNNDSNNDNPSPSSDLSAQLKSPTSPVAALTRYPRTPAPPRPLIPKRQPSFVADEPADRKQLKTLILDLDETLIHSMSKGGRMGGSGHMVEVGLNTSNFNPANPVVPSTSSSSSSPSSSSPSTLSSSSSASAAGTAQQAPQHPILYYVHKRPYCDEFLRKVSKWFNLVIFTASVQEYADPVIDWLETERRFFSARLYRQHCTFRHGAFIKDLSSVEPDLSRVVILDNSPLSYMFHQDNAIPIQGWINDPTDNDLLHLVPMLEGLQYVSDVRALLALRGGEDGSHSSG